MLLAFLAAAGTPAEGRDRVLVVGSSTLFPFATAVAETLGREGRWKTAVVESTGTGAGFQLFCRGTAITTPDVTDASRPMTDSERAACQRNGVGPVAAIRVGSDGIVIASSRRAPPFDLTREQLYRATARTLPVGGRLVANPYRRWSDIAPGLPRRAIAILGPAPNHGTRDAFTALALVPVCERQPEIRALTAAQRSVACQALREDGAWTDVAADYQILLSRLARDPDAVGVLTFSFLIRNPDVIRAAAIDGVAPTVQSIRAWTYPLARPLFLYVKQAHLRSVPGLAEFVAEFVSERAAGEDGYLAERGLAPLPKAWRLAELRKAQALAKPAP